MRRLHQVALSFACAACSGRNHQVLTGPDGPDGGGSPDGASVGGPTTPSLFAPPVEIATFGSNIFLAVGDLNGDGKPDLALVFNNSDPFDCGLGPQGGLEVFLNTTTTGATTPTFSTGSVFLYGTGAADFTDGTAPIAIAIADVNGDHSPDLLVLLGRVGLGEQLAVLLNTTATGATTPTFAPDVDFSIPTEFGPFGLATGDFNGDGKPDVAVAAGDPGTYVFLNTTTTGATTPSFAPMFTFASHSTSGISTGDLNGDSKPDIVVMQTGPEDGPTELTALIDTTAMAATTPSFATSDLPAGGSDLGLSSVELGDINGDGKLDIVTGNQDSLSVSLNTTVADALTPTFSTRFDFMLKDPGSTVQRIVVDDLDNDGKPDIVFSLGELAFSLNTTPVNATTPTFAPTQYLADPAPSGESPGTVYGVAVADFNGDGKPDIATAKDNDQVTIRLAR
jgi:hypothetical protein